MAFSALPQVRNLGLLVLLLLLCLYTALASLFPWTEAEGQNTVIALTNAQYLGFVAVASCFISYLWLNSYFRYALGITLLLNTFNLIAFLPFVTSMGLALGDTQIGLNPLALPLLIAYYLLNRDAAHTFIRKYLLLASPPKVVAHQHRESIDQFKQTFSRKSDESLQQITAENKLVAAAVTAARELLQERGTAAR